MPIFVSSCGYFMRRPTLLTRGIHIHIYFSEAGFCFAKRMILPDPYYKLVGVTGFEPATSRPPAVRASQLRHTPIFTIIPDGFIIATYGTKRY